jgi:N6-L-threonylcarbamoyladenine synthase
MKILGIETSCDETAASIVEAKIKNQKSKIKILSNIISSQVDLHKKYGGVYPELAARAHLENIPLVLEAALDKAKTDLKDIKLIAVTIGPGLIGSLLVGVNTAKTLAYSLNKPIIGVNHIEGHIYSIFGGEILNPYCRQRRQCCEGRVSKILIKFPALCLIVSGGHTSLVLMKNHGKYQIIGQALDDAAGEAFDKVAKLLGLGYPGGPAIEKAAQEEKLKTKNSKLKTTTKNLKLPRPMLDSSDFNFSFAGLKTAVLYMVKQIPNGRIENVRRLIAAEFQQAVIDVLVEKTINAAKKYKIQTIMMAGGVAANKLLRRTMESKIKKLIPNSQFLIPPLTLCTDNAAMVAVAGYFKTLKNKPDKWYNVSADANAKLI